MLSSFMQEVCHYFAFALQLRAKPPHGDADAMMGWGGGKKLTTVVTADEPVEFEEYPVEVGTLEEDYCSI